MVDLRELLYFYRDAGADAALADEPVNRFAEAEQAGVAAKAPAAPASAPAPERVPASVALAVPDEGQALLARQLAAGAEDLAGLRALLDAFDGCNLKHTATQLVFSDGNPGGPVMVIGEAPGREEDLEGKPFVGRSGRLLDRILAAIGLNRRDNVYIANVVPWRPPGNRTPTPHETEICRPFIERQIELADPRIIVTLGGPSSKAILGVTDGIMRLRGRWMTHNTASGRAIPAMPTLHPAYLLRNPAHKRLVWRDMLEVRMRLSEAERG